MENPATNPRTTRQWLDDLGDRDVTDMPDYKAGAQARRDGKSRTEVPIDGSFERAFLWLIGFHDDRLDSMLRHSRDKLDIIQMVCKAAPGTFKLLKPGQEGP